MHPPVHFLLFDPVRPGRIKPGPAVRGRQHRIAMKWNSDRTTHALWLTALALLCFWQLGAAPLNETDEGFAANRAASFFRHGTFLVSFDDVDSDEPQFRKPPLLYWVTAASLKLFGWNLWAVRLPVALAGFGCCLLLYHLFRPALGEGVTRLAVLGFATVPFVLWHVRTAMLELPLFFLVLLALHLLLQCTECRGSPLWAGLVAGSAILLKGGAGLLAPGALLLCGPALIRPWPRALRRTVIALAAAALPLAIYLLLLPADWRDGFIQGGAVREGTARLSRLSLDHRVQSVAEPLLRNLRWYLPAAAAGVVVLLIGLRQERAWRGWLWLGLVVSVPVVLLGAKQVVPYPRYFLPAYPFLITLAALFCWQVPRRPWAAGLLVPFAVASFRLESGGLRWIPIAAAGACALVVAVSGRRPLAPRAQVLLSALLFTAIAAPSRASALVVGVWPISIEHPLPAVARLADKAHDLVPAGEKIVAGKGFKYHTLLFHGRRALTTFPTWLAEEFPPVTPRIGLFHGRPFDRVPGLVAEPLGREDDWHLVRLDAEPAARHARGVLLVEAPDQPATRAALDLLQARYQESARGFVITQVPTRAEQPLAADQVKLATPGGAGDYIALAPEPGVEWQLDAPRRLTGMDLIPIKRQEVISAFTVDVRSSSDAEWREVARVADQPDGYRERQGGRIVGAAQRAIRVRFDPVVADRIRVTKTLPTRSRLAGVTVWAEVGP